MTVSKLIRDGKVAVLVSGGFGAGWSTWGTSERREEMMFDPDIAAALLPVREAEEQGEEKIAKQLFGLVVQLIDSKYPDEYKNGIGGLFVEWLPVGSKFYIREYDGQESVIREENLIYTA